MPNLTEGKYPGEFIYSQGLGEFSRDTITLIAGQKLNAGDVLGKILVGAASSAAGGDNTGNGTMSAVTLSQGALPGVYTLTALSATKFLVEDASGHELGVATTGVAFTAGGVSFTLTAGGTAFVVGDSFTITVAAGSGKYTAFAPAAADGSQTATAVLWANTDATSADMSCVAVTRHAEVNAAEIGWGAANAGQITAGIASLAARGIIVRAAA